MATKRLIDANKAIAYMNQVETDSPFDDKEDILEKCLNILKLCPTEDSVEVVRCKDCKWFEPNEDIMPESGSCAYHETIKMFWDYCSRAKMDGDGND